MWMWNKKKNKTSKKDISGAVLYSILFCLLFGADINYPAWLVVCVWASESLCMCLCVTWSWVELCRLHAHPGSALQGNVGVVSARPLTLGLSTCITHAHTHTHIDTHTPTNTCVHNMQSHGCTHAELTHMQKQIYTPTHRRTESIEDFISLS